MKKCIWIALGWLVPATTVYAVSFDCGKVSSKIEKIICSSPKLSALDDDLDKTYKAVQGSSTHEELQRLISDQRQWLKGIRNACGDESCLMQVYLTRIAAIKLITDKNAPPLDTLGKLTAPVGKGYPEDIHQVNGNLVFSHYDDNGNTRSIVDFDFTTGKWTNIVQGRNQPRLLAVNSQYIVLNTPHSASFSVEIINRQTGESTKKIKLRAPVVDAHITGNQLVLLQGESGGRYMQKVSILDLLTLRTVQETTIKGEVIKSPQDDKIFTFYPEKVGKTLLIVYDLQLKEIGSVVIPPPKDMPGRYCQPTSLFQEGDRAVLSANCGEIPVINLRDFSIERTIPRYADFYSIALYKGLIFTTTEKQNGIVVFDMNTARELARLPIPATKIFSKGNTLLTVGAPINGRSASWPMETYQINAEAIRSGLWRDQAIITACSQANQLIQKRSYIYEAVKLCGQSGIGGMIDKPSIPTDILPHVLNYATWLSQTLHRYDESLNIFDKLRNLGVPVNSAAVNEATIKKEVFDPAIDLNSIKANTDGTFAKALKLGLSQKPSKTIQLPKLQGHLYFMDENIYAPRWDCYPVAGDGVGIEVYSRKTLDRITRLNVRDCDEEQQDNIESISADQNEVYVKTFFRYPDEARTNYFVFDKSSWELVTEKVFVSGSDVLPQTDNEQKPPARYSSLQNEFATKSYRVRREYITRTYPGSTNYVFYRNDNAGISGAGIATFPMQGTSSSTPIAVPNKDAVVFIGNPDDLGRLSLIYFDPVTSNSITFAVLPIVAAWAIDEKNLYVSNGVDIMIFNLANLALARVIPKVFQNEASAINSESARLRSSSGAPAAAPAAVHSSNEIKIANIYLDQGRMIVRTLYGKSRVFNIENE